MSDNQTPEQSEPRQQRFALSWGDESADADQQETPTAAETGMPPADAVAQTESPVKEPVTMENQAPNPTSGDAEASQPVDEGTAAVEPQPKKLLLKKPAPDVRTDVPAAAGEAAAPAPAPVLAQRSDEPLAADSAPQRKVIQAVDSQTIKLAAKARSGKTDALKPKSVEPPPNGLGAMLLEARKARGLEVSAVAEDTRINSEYIAALEAEDFDNLPLAAIYIKSYLKTLARRYGLEPESLIEMYEDRQSEGPDAANETAAEAAGQKAADKMTGASNESNADTEAIRFKRYAWAMAAVVALVLCIIGAALVKSRFLSPGPVSKDDLTVLTSEDLERFTPPQTLPFSELEMPRKSQAAADNR